MMANSLVLASVLGAGCVGIVHLATRSEGAARAGVRTAFWLLLFSTAYITGTLPLEVLAVHPFYSLLVMGLVAAPQAIIASISGLIAGLIHRRMSGSRGPKDHIRIACLVTVPYVLMQLALLELVGHQLFR